MSPVSTGISVQHLESVTWLILQLDYNWFFARPNVVEMAQRALPGLWHCARGERPGVSAYTAGGEDSRFFNVY